MFFQDAVTNAVAFASYDGDLKQYIFTFVGQRSTW